MVSSIFRHRTILVLAAMLCSLVSVARPSARTSVAVVTDSLTYSHASEAIDAGEAAHLEPAVRGVASWVASDLARGPFDALREHLEYSDALVLDPPRGGVCAELLADIAQTSARKIVYVSCDPPALARDISRLYSAGWRVKHVEAWDMFPRTAHLEVIVELYRSW